MFSHLLVPSMGKIQENIAYHKTFTEKFNAIKEKLVPDQNMLLSTFILDYNLDLVPKTRFGATPVHPNTFYNYQPPQSSGMHLDEDNRFKGAKDLNTKVAFQKAEKEMRDSKYFAKITRLQGHQKTLVDTLNERDLKMNIDDKTSVQNRVARLQAYEEVYN